MQLTDEQRHIVQHHQGAAIVYAVAGAGKSTTMAHRVRHLVQAHAVEPQRILVCSFSRETVNDIRRKIENLGVTGVQCQTFNALGRRIVQQAIHLGFWQPFDETHIEHRSSQLAMRALVEMSRRHGKNFATLDVNQEDLQTFVSVCKGNLRYANLGQSNLPAHALVHAAQAEHENPYYAHAYQLYEHIRQQQNCLTFDDQLVLGWEALERFPDVRAWAKSRFDYVLIDEFQDVNKVQVQIADILTEDHRNYMAIGDDDQCIYEWRGADVRFILDFKKRYNASEYVISDNFRCPAEATLLAGQVISRNSQRHAKDLVSQKGFGGEVVLKGFDNDSLMAAYVVQTYQQLLQHNHSAQDVIVLVRAYSQTPPIEARLIQAGLAYHIVGSQPFYERPEVKVLFTYLSFARQEKAYQDQGGNDALSNQYVRRFADILRSPNRYLSNDWINQFVQVGQQQSSSLVNFLEQQLTTVPNQAALKRLQKLVMILRQLQQRLTHEVGATLQWLISELEYLDALKSAAGLPELGEERCNNVRALVSYAQKKGTVLQFLEHLRQLHMESDANSDKPRLQIMSIHRSKGLEWQTVFVPCCAEEQLPAGNHDNLEEERRLLYVAMTRSKQQLHLLYSPAKKMSVFLREVQAESILQNTVKLKTALHLEPHTPQPDDAINLALGLKLYPLARYLRLWWPAHRQQKLLLAQQAYLALNKQAEAQQQLAEFKTTSSPQSPKEAQAQRQQQLKSLERRLQLFKTRPVTVVLDKPAPENGFGQQRFRFEKVDNHTIRMLSPQGHKLGLVDIKASRFPLTEIYDWAWVAAQVSTGFRFSYLRRTVNVTLEVGIKPQQLQAQTVEVAAPPATTQYFASAAFQHDIEQLVQLLAE